MRRVRSLLAAAVLGAGLLSLPAWAGDPAPSSEEGARVRHLIDDLGSDDFRVREGAQKALSAYGGKALEALRAATSHPNAEVRFRAEQLVKQIEGAPRERRLDADEPDVPRGRDDVPSLGHGDLDREIGRLLQDNRAWVERLERQMREMQEWVREGRPGSAVRPDWLRRWTETPKAHRAQAAEQVFERGGARLVVRPDGSARLSVQKKDDAGDKELVVEGPSLAALREKVYADSSLRDDTGVASVLRQSRRAHRFPGLPGVPGVDGFGGGILVAPQVRTEGLAIVHGPDGVKVTITESGPDGKPVAKTYAAKDLETLKREHPEVAGRLGGFHIDIGPGFGPGARWKDHDLFGPRAPRPVAPPALRGAPGLRDDDEGDDDDEGMDDDADDDEGEDDDAEGDDEDDAPQTGPFGIGIGSLDESLRLHLGLAEDAAARVIAVRPDSPAAQVGLRIHDLITAVDGPNGKVAGGGAQALAKALRGAEKGGPLSIDVIRGGKPIKLSR